MCDLTYYTEAKEYVKNFHSLFNNVLHKELERLKTEKKIDEFVILMELKYPKSSEDNYMIAKNHDLLIKSMPSRDIQRLNHKCIQLYIKMRDIMSDIHNQYYKEPRTGPVHHDRNIYEKYFEKKADGILYNEFYNLTEELRIICHILYERGE